MRPYIVLNGISSQSIKGLLIQELPPIVKPKLRTDTEEIDGMDGDIVTELGYEAYDQEVSIGLYGNYNIDEIVEYFNSSGEVVFSNQPERCQKYIITDQIDFERLVCFRTATVTFHVQPFKYEYGETLVTINDTDKLKNGFKLINKGNIIARPLMNIYGSGTINVYLNGEQIFKIELDSSSDYITIDLEKFNAYKDSTSNLKNRIVTGNYDSFYLKPHKQESIYFEGDITKLEIGRTARWV